MDEPDNSEKPDKCPACGRFTTKEIIELLPAYMWDCPSCGRENFQRSITLAMTDEDIVELGLNSGESGTWQSYPDVVTCRFCSKQYQTRHINESEDEDLIEDE